MERLGPEQTWRSPEGWDNLGCTRAREFPSQRENGLIEAVRQICLEDGTLSEWLYEVLSPHAEEVAVAAVSESRGPAASKREDFVVELPKEAQPLAEMLCEEREALAALKARAKKAMLVPDPRLARRPPLPSGWPSNTSPTLAREPSPLLGRSPGDPPPTMPSYKRIP